jgi:hypothetical protein
MTDASPISDATDLWMRLWLPWASLAPRELSQPINPGWTFGNVVINERNSSAPETEQAILAEESYGRQIGKLLEAVCELIKESPGGSDNQAFRDIATLRDKVERLKCEAAATRIDQLRRDLELLKASDKAAYETKIEALRSLLPGAATSGP